ncbi:ABC transporter permease [Bacillus sp. 1P06AnD]|uniref:ABC transporter permease n=1 Tax=Bacillus sp. 1P06AnD TaxID=3132208 RepID=UPI0039A12FA4
MNQFSILFFKEVRSLWRSNKWIWVPIVLILLSVMQPLSMYYMDDIMKLSGSMPEGTVFKMPVPTTGEIISSILSQYNTIGILLCVVVTMGAISDERRSGAMVFLYTRPVRMMQIVLSKFAAYGLLMVFSISSGFIAGAYYTVVLFSSINWESALTGLGLYLIYILLVVAFVLTCSALFNHNGTISMISVVVIGALSVLGGWFTVPLQWLPTRMSGYAAGLASGNGLSSGFTSCLIVSVLAIIILNLVTSYAMKIKTT